MNNDEKELSELLNMLSKLKEDMGITDEELNSESDSDFESLMSMSFDEMDQEFIKNSKTKTIKVKKLHPDAITPSYNYESDSGFDLYSMEEITIPPLGRALIPTGISVQFEEELEIQVRTKSGLAINQGLIVLNSPGTVDQGYTGEVKVPILNVNPTSIHITKGMKVAQGVLCPVVNGKFVKIEEVKEIEQKDRGDKGFGSTGI